MNDQRINELIALAEAQGLTLPYPPETIVAMEDVGCVVNLRTGEIVIGESDRPYMWELTEAGRELAKRGAL